MKSRREGLMDKKNINITLNCIKVHLLAHASNGGCSDTIITRQGNATDPHHIKIEEFIVLQDCGINEATNIINKIHNTAIIQRDLFKSIFVALLNKKEIKRSCFRPPILHCGG